MPTINLLGVPVVLLSSIENVYIDSLDSVTVQEDNLVTEHPTETGANVADHICPLPTKISMSGRFVDAPFAVNGVDFLNPVQAATTAVASKLQSGLSVQQWKVMEQLKRRQKPVTIVIQHGTYKNMAITRLAGPREPGDGGSMRVQIELIEINITSLLTATGMPVADRYADGANAPAGLGAQAPVPWGGPIP